MNIPQIALRNIFRNKRRSLLSLSAICVVTTAIVFMFSIIEGMKADQETTAQRFITGEARVRNPGFEEFQFTYPEEFLIKDYESALAAVESAPGVTEHSGRAQFPVQIAVAWEIMNRGTDAEFNFIDQTVSALVFGLDFEHDTGYFSLGPYIKDDGRIPGKNEILIADGFAHKFGLKTGDTVLLSGVDSPPLAITGIVSLPVIQLGQKAVFMPLSTVQDLLNLPGQAQEILIRFDGNGELSANIASVTRALDRAGFPGMEVKAWHEIGMTGTWLAMASLMFNFIALFFFIMGATVIANTTMMVIYERMREIGTLRAMGMKGKEMIWLFFMEAFFISLAAAFTGVFLGTALVLPLSLSGIDLGMLADVGKMNIAVSNVIYPQINPYTTLFVFVYSVAVASLISFIPTRRAAKIEPVEALRSI